MLHETDLAWLAGFIDGDGSFYLKQFHRTDSHVPGYHAVLQICQVDKQTLLDAAHIIEQVVGHAVSVTRGRKPTSAGHGVWRLSVQRRSSLKKLIRALLPHLRQKEAEALALLPWCDPVKSGNRKGLTYSRQKSLDFFDQRVTSRRKSRVAA